MSLGSEGRGQHLVRVVSNIIQSVSLVLVQLACLQRALVAAKRRPRPLFLIQIPLETKLN